MSHIPLPVVAAPAIDLAALRLALLDGLSGEVRMDRISRALYSTDASIYQIVPLAVTLPRTVADIQHILQVCRRFQVPITVRGGGTSQAGQSIGAGVILDCSRFFNRVLEVNASERWVRVQPGCVLADLNENVRPLGLHFAPDISTANRATIGGMLANNSSGTRSIIYGKTIDHVLELTMLLADGSIAQAGPYPNAQGDGPGDPSCTVVDGGEGADLCYRTVLRLAAEHADEIEGRYPKILRRVGGYNLDMFRPGRAINFANLFVGSEGTLGIVLEAKLKLVELPRARGVLVVQFHDLLEALSATPHILRHRPSAVEVMDRYILDSTRRNPEAARLRDFLDGDPGAILIIEFCSPHPASRERGAGGEMPMGGGEGGDDAGQVAERLKALESDLLERGSGYHVLRAQDAALQQRIWKLRTLALGLSMAEKGDAKSISFVEDTAVDPGVLRDYIEEFLGIIERHGTRAGVYAHASVGCLHVRPVINLKSDEGVRQFKGIAEDVADLVLKYQGALSGEHGDGMVRSPFQEKMFGPVLYQAFRDIKKAFDPHNLLNPGKIVDPAPLAANLRYGPGYVTPEVDSVFDFTADGGLARAAELCAGVGECRKTRGGMMCPSYRATRDEQHSTRGRANTLRLAITGQAALHGLTDPALHEVFDLCLECKACKSECPTNVDMARLKAEYLHQTFAKHGLPWRNWLFGNVARMTRNGGSIGNWWIRSAAGRWLNDQLFGIDARRRPPRVARKSLQQMFAAEQLTAGGPQVLLFPDTFTNYFEPEIGLAARAVLTKLGWDVWYAKSLPQERPIGPVVCCGRPFISNGMLRQAVQHAAQNVNALYDWAAAGRHIFACEPSCILTIKDDYPALLRNELQHKAHVVAERCVTFEELVDESGFSVQRSGNMSQTILVQGHCHQSSLVGMGPLLRTMAGIRGTKVVDLDAGCCGMAGSFGYEKEHYELSRAVGEQSLFPALRKATDGVVVAPGFSCRMQIEHFLGRKAVHPATLLHELLSAASGADSLEKSS